MGWIKDSIEDIGWLVSLRDKRWSHRILVLTSIALLAYFAVDSRRLGDTAADWLTVHGISSLNHVEITPDLRITNDPLRDNNDNVDIQVTSNGTVRPIPDGNHVVMSLHRIEEKSSKVLDSQESRIDEQGTWFTQRPFTIKEPGDYVVSYEILKGFQTIGSTSRAVAGVPRNTTSDFDSTFFIKPLLANDLPSVAIRTGSDDRRSVSIYYFGDPNTLNFKTDVFEELLLRLNPVLRSLEIEIPEGPAIQPPAGATPDTLMELLRSKQHSGVDVVVGITGQSIGDHIYYQVDARGDKLLLVSTSNIDVFSTHSQPSVYKYLLTAIVSVAAIQARLGSQAIWFHNETRGCLFDSDSEQSSVEVRLSMGIAYLCRLDQARLKSSLTQAEYADLTGALPLRWLK